MSDGDVTRRLAAILAADVAGYTRMMEVDEAATLDAWWSARREIIDPGIAEHGGRIVKHTGDGFLAEFGTATEAVRCAAAMQTALAAANAERPQANRLDFRMGVNLGEIVVDQEDIYGEGVNLAARLESLAKPGGICISALVHEQVRNRLEFEYEYLGARRVKHVAEPVRHYRVILEGEAPRHAHASSAVRRLSAVRRVLTPLRLLAAVVVLVLVAGFWPSSGPAPERTARAAPIISVVPFRIIGGNAPEGFSEGLTEDLVTALSARSSWRVVRRDAGASNQQQGGKERAYHFEGSVRRVGDTIRVSAQLIDPQSGFHLWGGRYDRKLVDELAIQNEVSQRIVATLSLRIQDAEAARYAADDSSMGMARGLLYRGLTGLGRLAEAAAFLPQELIDWVSGGNSSRPAGDSADRVEVRYSGADLGDDEKQDRV
ncbi:MAG: adenylate/guanylate cyclase domain-containing protein [Alphaproteobacteria bacterium]|jgi:class 3 adenylate cyclase/TolB-like protein|nr:adenylate/guanylate cyclase domain-containing protein [Alphaproteobacteria bacterium]